MERDECFRRQLAEVEALASIFCAPGEITFNSAHISALRAVLESNNLPFDLSNSTQIVIHRALQLEVNTAKVSVSFSLPQTYPLSADPHIRVTCSGFLKDSSERIELLLREHARSREPKAECIFDLVSEVDNFLSTLSSTTTNLPTKKMPSAPLSTTRTDNTAATTTTTKPMPVNKKHVSFGWTTCEINPNTSKFSQDGLKTFH
eukprot:c10875_g1_i2.p1 GENE.c10875_g1_i2~~c10875_g1_i2.p1  ORF type:complete len:204 (+),score=35.10 c10875_g1_i2:66-677(+)